MPDESALGTDTALGGVWLPSGLAVCRASSLVLSALVARLLFADYFPASLLKVLMDLCRKSTGTLKLSFGKMSSAETKYWVMPSAVELYLAMNA